MNWHIVDYRMIWYTADDHIQHVEWQNSLRERFPELFPKYHVHILVSRGWQLLIEELLTGIQLIVHERGIVVRVHRVQESALGGLWFRCVGADDMVQALIRGAASSALCVCERCGGEGEDCLYKRWCKVLCDEHFSEWVQQMHQLQDEIVNIE